MTNTRDPSELLVSETEDSIVYDFTRKQVLGTLLHLISKVDPRINTAGAEDHNVTVEIYDPDSQDDDVLIRFVIEKESADD